MKNLRPDMEGRAELIRLINQMKTGKLAEDYEYDDEPVELTREADDDDGLKYYSPGIAHVYWNKERYSILEQRQYERDVCSTQGFEVGYYPYLMRNSSSLIIRYYCPPDANLSDDAIAHLHGLANHAIQFYNSAEYFVMLPANHSSVFPISWATELV
ncbi:hypothetical protein POM88_043126 [Heracleum sosnowskyi]|uniref:Uncharacterized protein n=1 Tax=Heracleum sosnowskyi TaxID=360622 RepID=A0AAD8M400_9APIA|nr:hypothetical protein POM88_043126 [Heracleum sosnowskyi]